MHRESVAMKMSRLTALMLVVAGLLVATGVNRSIAQEPAGSGFRPGEISIGEPLALPFGGPTAQQPANGAAAQGTAASIAPGGAPRPAAVGLPGSGWLGLTLAESSVPGRWRIDDVMPGGPASRAGIEPGDELRAVNGVPLAGAEEVSAVMTAIASGQTVRVAVARDDDLQELVLEAVPRPSATQTREQPPAFDAAQPRASGLEPPTPQPSQSAPSQSAPSQSAPFQSAPSQPAPFQSAPFQTAPPVQAAPDPNPIAAEPRPATARGGGPQPIVAQPVPRSPAAPPAVAATALPPPERMPDAGQWDRGRRDADGRNDAAAGSVLSGSRITGSAAAGGRIALGVRTLPIDAVTQSRFNLAEPAGAYVLGVVQDLPASRAGVPPGSVIVSLDGRPVRSPNDLTQLVTAGPLDRPVTLQFVLPGGESRRASVALQSLEAPVVEALAGPQAVGSIPTLEPGPRRSERPVTGGPASDAEATAIRQELRLLRDRLERLERRLQAVEPSFRR